MSWLPVSFRQSGVYGGAPTKAPPARPTSEATVVAARRKTGADAKIGRSAGANAITRAIASADRLPAGSRRLHQDLTIEGSVNARRGFLNDLRRSTITRRWWTAYRPGTVTQQPTVWP